MLIAYRTACFAGGLTGRPALPAAAVLFYFIDLRRGNNLNVFHK
jgi:hypothetical protein